MSNKTHQKLEKYKKERNRNMQVTKLDNCKKTPTRNKLWPLPIPGADARCRETCLKFNPSLVLTIFYIRPLIFVEFRYFHA